MKRILFAAAAVVLAAVSCQKEEFAAPAEGTTVLEVSLDNASKTGLTAPDSEGHRKIYWLKGDKLSWSGTASEALGDDFTAKAAKTSATFTWEGILDKPCDILYPASMYTDDTHITLPATQADSKAEDAIATDVLPMYAHVADGASVPALKSLTGLVKISWKLPAEDADSHKMTFIEFKGNNNEQVSGKFSIDYKTGVLSSVSTADADKEVRVVASRTATAETPCCCLISVPAGTYSKGFTVKLIDQYGHYMEKSKASSFIVEAGKVSVMPTFYFVPTGTEIGVEIDCAEAWNEFARAFNENPEEYSKPVEITGDLDFLGTEMVSLGTEDDAFPMAINGNDHILSNVKDGKVSLIYNLGATGILKNLTVGDDCNFVADYPDPEKLFLCSPLVSKLTGTVLNCENRATITIEGYSEEEIEAGMPAEHNSEGYIGGIAAYILSGACIIDCKNSGNITVENTFKDDASLSIASSRFAIGGIAGYGNGKEFRNCENSADITVNYAINGCIIGGISGGVSGDYFNCINSGNLSKVNGTSVKNRNEYLAGINAYSWSEGKKYYDCSNSGNITASGAFKVSYLGGITAYNTRSFDLQRCSNSGNLKATDQQLAYQRTTIGGLVGYTKYAQTFDLTGCSVTGELALSFNAKSSSDADQVAIGGIVGLCGEGVTVEGKGFTINPNIHVTFSSVEKKVYDSDFFGIGAIVGVNREVNSGTKGTVIIKGCKVDGGIVQIDNMNKNSTKFRYNNLGVGGILGISLVEGAEISDCEIKSATVGISPSGRNTGSCTSEANLAVGGIAGRVIGGTSSISNCKFLNSSSLYANVYHSLNETKQSLNVGGIIGECVDAENTITISNCTVGLKKGSFDRAMVGGIAGKASNAIITNCSVDLGTATFASARSSAGIVGMITNGNVSGCTVIASAEKAIFCSYTSSTHEFGGGVVAVANNTAFTNCKSFANIFANKGCDASNPRFVASAVGGLVAKAENGCTFENCSCGGTLGDTASSGKPGVITGTETAKTITISKDNVDTYAVMAGDDGNAYVPGTYTFTYWDGTL